MFDAFSDIEFTKQTMVIFASLLMAIVIAYLTTPLAIKVAKLIGAVDVPKDSRRMHKRPIPLLGGLAIILAFLVTSIVLTRYHRLLFTILPGALIIVIVGVIDDKWALPAWPKLLFQCLAATIPIMVNPHILITAINGFGIGGVNNIPLNSFFSIFITIIWIVGITNAVNLIDGLDGLAAGISTIASVSMLIIAFLKMSVDYNEYGVAVLCAALAGGCLGLLPYNKHPAKVFMGDTGATFLGYTLAVISLQGLLKTYAAISFIVPLLILGLPILDTLVAIIRRLFNHKSPFAADRSHIHHKLIDLGLTQDQAVWLLYISSGVMGLVAIIFAALGTATGLSFMLIAVMLIIVVYIIAIPVCQKVNLFGKRKNINPHRRDDHNYSHKHHHDIE